MVFWQRAPLAWGSRKQQSIALSSRENEIIALSEAAKDVVYFRKFVLGIDASSFDGLTDCATNIKSAKDLPYNPEHHNRTKHVERRHFFIRDMVEKPVTPLLQALAPRRCFSILTGIGTM